MFFSPPHNSPKGGSNSPKRWLPVAKKVVEEEETEVLLTFLEKQVHNTSVLWLIHHILLWLNCLLEDI